MRPIKYVIILTTFAAISLITCEKSKDANNIPNQTDTIFSRVTIRGQILIPTGSIPLSTLSINTGILSSVKPNTDGSFSSTVNEGATQLMYAKTPDGNLCLLNILINPQANNKIELTPYTTAKALIFLNPAAIVADPGLSQTIMTLIDNLPETQLLADIISQKIKSDPDVLMTENADISAALTNAISKFIETITSMGKDGSTKADYYINRFKEIKHYGETNNYDKSTVTTLPTVGDISISPSGSLSGVSVLAKQIDQNNYSIEVTNSKKRFIGAYLDDAKTGIALANALLQSRKNLISFEPLSPITKPLSNNLNLDLHPSNKLYIYGLGANDFESLMNAPDWFNRIIVPAVYTCVSDYLTPLLQVVSGITKFKMIGDWDNPLGVYGQIIKDVLTDAKLMSNLAIQIQDGDYTGIITSVLLRCVESMIDNPSYILSWLQEQGCDLLISAASAAILPLRIFFIVTSGFELSAAIYDFATSSFLVVYSLDKTQEIQKPTVTTNPVEEITSTSATVGGNVTSDGGATVTERGVYWSTSSNPENTGTKLQIDDGTGSFSKTLNGLNSTTTYYVKAYAENSAGVAFGSQVNFTTLGNPPIANFTASPTTVTAGQSVLFTDQSTNNPTSWSWNFGDGGTSTQQNPSHTYNTAGTYTVSLTATNSYGSDIETKTNYITVNAVGTAPVANFTGSPTTVTAGQSVLFADQSTNNPTSWSWNFGDGGTSTQQNPSHTYNIAGTYTVSLTATNSYGSDIETKTNFITVNAAGTAPVANFTGSPTTVTAGQSVLFADQSINNPTSWSWNFGDGGTSTQQNPSHTYNTAGTYTVSLTATNSYGSDIETKTSYITVNAAGIAPVVDFTASITTPTVGQSVLFTDQSINNPISWSWNFGDGGTSTQQNPAHTYNATGTYTVSLTASNNYGSNSKGKTNYIIVISASSEIIFNPNLTYGNVTDIEGNVYKTIQIGTQTWMAENLKTTKYNDNTSMPLLTDISPLARSYSPAYCWSNNDPGTYKAIYGALYNWYAVSNTTNGGKNICPTGWHVPTEDEWHTLALTLDPNATGPLLYFGTASYIAGGKMKEIGNIHWNISDQVGTNESGFTALPGGDFYFFDYEDSIPGMKNWDEVKFPLNGIKGFWWSSTEYPTNWVWNRAIHYLDNHLDDEQQYKWAGFSVRCLKDN